MATPKLPATVGRNDITLYVPEEGAEASFRAGHAVISQEVSLSDFLPAIQIVGLSSLRIKGVRNNSLVVEIDGQEHRADRVLGDNLLPLTFVQLAHLAQAYCDVNFEVS